MEIKDQFEQQLREIRYQKLNEEFAAWAIKGAIIVIMAANGAVEGGPSMSEDAIEEQVVNMTHAQKVKALKIAANLLEDHGKE